MSHTKHTATQTAPRQKVSKCRCYQNTKIDAKGHTTDIHYLPPWNGLPKGLNLNQVHKEAYYIQI